MTKKEKNLIYSEIIIIRQTGEAIEYFSSKEKVVECLMKKGELYFNAHIPSPLFKIVKKDDEYIVYHSYYNSGNYNINPYDLYFNDNFYNSYNDREKLECCRHEIEELIK